jgi:hypothetical protein
MDANKLIALKALPYVIQPVCGLCKHGKFPNNDWGSCEATKYEHLKHSEATRDISIHRYGSCPNFESDVVRVGMLARFQEFFEDPEELWKNVAEAWKRAGEQFSSVNEKLDNFISELKQIGTK